MAEPAAPAADIENRLIALAVAFCDALAPISGEYGQATDVALVCSLPRGHGGDLHCDQWDGIWWTQKKPESEP